MARKEDKEKHFILILSFLAGIFTALAAWFLKFLVEWIKEFLTENFDSTGVNWLYLVYPVLVFSYRIVHSLYCER